MMDAKPSYVTSLTIHQKDHVLVSNAADLEMKLRCLITEGPAKLLVLADFDGTLTKWDAIKSLDSYNIFCKTKTLSQTYLEKFATLWAQIMPIYRNHELPEDQKDEAINRWFLEMENLTTRESVTVKDIGEAIDDNNIKLRDGCDKMLSVLLDLGVPLNVMSAGMGDVINYMLRDFKPKAVISNFLTFNETGRVLGFTRPSVTVYNKHTISLPVEEGRHNVILLGDSPEDCRMAGSVSGAKTVLKIGFLDGRNESKLQKFLDTFDIVLAGDGATETVTAILIMIAGGS